MPSRQCTMSESYSIYEDNTYPEITCFFVPSTTRHFSQLLQIRIFSNSGRNLSRTPHYFAHERTTARPESYSRFCLSYVQKIGQKRHFFRCYLPNRQTVGNFNILFPVKMTNDKISSQQGELEEISLQDRPTF